MEQKPRFFDYDGAFMRFLQNVVDLIFLNLLFVVGCLPVLTVGGSLLALYEVSLSHCRYGRSKGILKEFWRAYRRHLRAGLLLTPVLALVIGSLVLDFMWLGSLSGTVRSGFLLALLVILALVLGMLLSYFLPLMSEGELSLWEATQKALYCCVIYWPRALLLSVIRSGFVVLCLHIPLVFLSSMPVFLIIGCSLCVLLYCMLLQSTLPEN